MSDSGSPEDQEEVMFTVNETELRVTEKITIFFIWLLIETIGNFMVFGLIHFDICAGDPLKRRISDQVGQFFPILNSSKCKTLSKSPFQLLSIIYAINIGSNVTILTIRTILTVFDLTLPLNISYFFLFCECLSIFYNLLTIIEISWLKYFYKFVWKSVRPLDEGFVVSCFTLNNIIFGALLTIAWIMSGSGKKWLMKVADPLEWHITFWISDPSETYFR